MNSCVRNKKQGVKSFNGIFKDILVFFAFFPAIKCLVSLFEIITSQEIMPNMGFFDYLIQFGSLGYVIYYIQKNIKQKQ